MKDSTAQNTSSSVTAKKSRKMVPLRYVLTPIAIILSALVIFALIAAFAPKPTKKPVIFKAPLVEVINVERQNITFSVKSQGSVLPRTETSLVSEVSGMVVEVSTKFQVGGFFNKGEQLMAIDDITYQVALVQAQSRLGSAKASLVEEKARAKQAKDEWLLSGKSLQSAPVLALRIPQQQKAEANLLAAQADLKAAEIKLGRTKIVAPYDALLKAKMVDIGQYVSTGTQLAITFAVDYAEVRLPIKQKDVAFLNLPRINRHQDKSATVELFYKVAGKTHRWSSHLSRYESVVDTSSRVHYVIAQVDDPYALEQGFSRNELHIGTFVNARVAGKLIKDVVAVPRGAVQGGNLINLIDSKNQLKVINIDVLRTDADYVYTYDQFPAQMRIITTKLATPVEGMLLRVNGEQIQSAAKTSENVTDSGEH